MKKTILPIIFIITALITFGKASFAYTNNSSCPFDFDWSFDSSITFDSDDYFFQISDSDISELSGNNEKFPNELENKSENNNNSNENSTPQPKQNKSQRASAGDFLFEHKSLFMVGIDTFWGSLGFFTIGGILEIGFPNIFDGFGWQFGFGFGVWDKGSEGDFAAIHMVLGIKYTLSANKIFYPSVGLRIFGVTTFSLFRDNDSNTGLELYFDIRIPFAEVLMVLLHFGPQIPMERSSKGIFTAGMTIALHF